MVQQAEQATGDDMGINITVDETLVAEARRLTGMSEDSAAVDEVLRRLFAGRSKHADLLDLVGKVQFFDGYDPKQMRSSRHDPD
jgi:Bacterial antitoxin of type II TA system, VapB